MHCIHVFDNVNTRTYVVSCMNDKAGQCVIRNVTLIQIVYMITRKIAKNLQNTHYSHTNTAAYIGGRTKIFNSKSN